jgi:hypothetical protein
MNYTSDDEIDSLLKEFENKTLPKRLWTHHAHLTAGMYYLYRFNFYEALCMIKARIMSYNEAVGGVNSPSEGYHETLTVYWLKVLDQFMSDKRTRPLFEICNSFLHSPFSDKELPFQHYGRERLMSVEARATWIGD